MKIVVVGLLPGQTNRIHRVGARFSFVEGRGAKQRPMPIPTGDVCVLMGKFVSHRTRDLVIGSFGRDRVVTVRGGLGELARVIDDIIARKKG